MSVLGIGALTLAVFLPMAPDVTHEPTEELRYSPTSDRSGSLRLDGATVSGDIYVYSESGESVRSVEFWMDDPERAGAPTRRDYAHPFDLVGGTRRAATALDTTLLADGTHSVEASALARGGVELGDTSARFTVANEATETAGSQLLRVSLAPDRSNSRPLDGADLSGADEIFVFWVDDGRLGSVEFWIDDPERARTSARRDWAAPFDLAGGRRAEAQPLATASLPPGPHTVTAVFRTRRTNEPGQAVETAQFVIDEPATDRKPATQASAAMRTTVPPRQATLAAGVPSQGASTTLPGHTRGKVYLGFAAPEPAYAREVGRVGVPTVRRGPYVQMSEISKEIRDIKQSTEACRLSWTSFKADWKAVAAGQVDDQLRARFAAYRSLDAPALATFAHEPVNDGAPEDFVAAWTHILDLADDVGTGQVSLVPIMNGFVWSSTRVGYSDQQIDDYLPASLLERWPMVGADVYDGQGRPGTPGLSVRDRLHAMLAWADRHDVEVLGIGETGVREASNWSDAWAFIEDNADRFMAVSYFNSGRNVRAGDEWYLKDDKLVAFQESLDSPTVAEPAGCAGEE